MSFANRDYLETVDLISKVYTTDFWEEELCYILNGDRERQIKYQGGSAEYLKDLLIKSNNATLQEILLKKAIKNFIIFYRFKDVVNNIENYKKSEEVITLISISREFCSKDSAIVEQFTNFFTLLNERKLSNKANQVLSLYNTKKIFNGIIYLVSEFLPIEFEYSYIKNSQYLQYSFLEKYYADINEFLKYDNDYLSHAIIFLLQYKYPIFFSINLSERIVKDNDILESIVYKFKKEFSILKKLIINISKTQYKDILFEKLSVMGIEYSSLLTNKKEDLSKDVEFSNSNIVDNYNYQNDPEFIALYSSLRSSKLDALGTLMNISKQNKHGKPSA